MSTETEELHRIISTSVRDMLDAYRIQASAGPVTDKVLEEIIFRAAHGVLQSLAPYPGEPGIASGQTNAAVVTAPVCRRPESIRTVLAIPTNSLRTAPTSQTRRQQPQSAHAPRSIENFP